MNKYSRHNFFKFLSPLTVFFFLSCAAIQPPSGGPKDETPPVLVDATPPSETTHFSGGEIRLRFSEYLDETSVERGLQISPRLSKPMTVKYKGDEILLRIPKELSPERTYIITLSREVKDEHGVPLANSIQLAYGTGDRIDKGMIKGRVVNDPNVVVHLWRMDENERNDSLFASPPHYVTDVDDEGGYQFGFLSPGGYRLMAISREAAGLPLDPRRFRYGLPWVEKITIDSNEVIAGINMLVWREPQPFKLLRGELQGATWGKLFFNNQLPSDSLTGEISFSVENGPFVPVSGWYRDPLEADNLVVEIPDSLYGKKLQMQIDSLGSGGKIILDSVRIGISVPDEPDTNYLELLRPENEVLITPGRGTDPPLELVFSQPLLPLLSAKDYPLLYIDDSLLVESITTRVNPLWLKLRPLIPWEPNKVYRVELFRSGFLSREGNAFEDSLITVTIRTRRRPGYGGLSVRIKSGGQYPFVGEIRAVEKPSQMYTSVVNSQARIAFSDIPEGTYTLMLYEDRDRNETYTFGKAFPFTPGEWFMTYPDTLDIRANWEIELTPISIKEFR